MSISIPGKLNVVEKNGRNGPFMVAELITDIGTFDVSNRVLDEFEQGTYDGVYILHRVFNKSVSWKNGTWTKLCAELDWDSLKIMAQSEEALSTPTLQISQMVQEDEQINQINPKQPVESYRDSAAPSQAAPIFSDDDLVSDMDSLNALISNGCTVKLDASIEDRELFRNLRDTLKQNGYKFDGKTQSWFLPHE